MDKRIQIAPLKGNFQRIIDFDRVYPASKIVVFITKNDTIIGTQNYQLIEKSLKKMREYCQLAKIQFNMQVIDCDSDKTLMGIVLDFTRALLVDAQTEHSFMINLGDTSLLMNIALVQAAQLVRSLANLEVKIFVHEICKNEEIIFEQDIVKSFEALISEPVSIKLLDCVEQNNNLDEIKNILNISLGSVSNHLKYLKEIGLISVKGHDRSLTNLGKLIKQILLLKDSLS
ncbi:MAG: hypothetical protein EAX90_09625 [Candidatus Heimdallarchaeota archaeon]|nr:hypothetical protein [Candidatus Heimdallarchaeota archaeon]